MLGKTEGGRRREQQRMRWLDGIMYWMDMSLSNFWELWWKGSLACCSAWCPRVRDNWATKMNWTEQSSPSVHSLSHVRLFATLWTAACQAYWLSPTPRACSNSCPLSQRCHPTISSSVVPFSSCLQSFPASGSFPMSWFFASGGHRTGVSASSVLPMNIQDWFSLGLIDWLDLLAVPGTLKSLL